MLRDRSLAKGVRGISLVRQMKFKPHRRPARGGRGEEEEEEEERKKGNSSNVNSSTEFESFRFSIDRLSRQFRNFSVPSFFIEAGKMQSRVSFSKSCRKLLGTRSRLRTILRQIIRLCIFHTISRFRRYNQICLLTLYFPHVIYFCVFLAVWHS